MRCDATRVQGLQVAIGWEAKSNNYPGDCAGGAGGKSLEFSLVVNWGVGLVDDVCIHTISQKKGEEGFLALSVNPEGCF